LPGGIFRNIFVSKENKTNFTKMKKLFLILLLCGTVTSQSMLFEAPHFSSSQSEGNKKNISEVTIPEGNNLIPHALERTSSVVPAGYYLGQYPPNKIDQLTNIYFSLPAAQHVRLVIMNILGQEIDVVINSELAAGTYKLSCDASSLSAGVYVCRMGSADFTDSRKMLLWN